MAETKWLKLVFLISQVTLVLSSVIVVKLDGEDNEEVKQIASIIEAKIHEQNEEIEMLKNITETQDYKISSLNSSMNYEHIQQEKVNNELRKVAQAQSNKIASLNSTFKDVYNTQQTEIEKLTEQNKEMEGKIQEILNKTKSRIPSWFYQTQLCYQWRPDGNGVNVGLENHDYCVLMWDQKLHTTEMTQIIGEVAVECSGPSILLMLNHGSRVSRYVIAGMQMEIVVNVVEVP